MSVATYGPAERLLAQHRRHGPVITSRLTRATYFLGPEANRFLFANSELFSWQQAFAGFVPINGPTALIVSDGEDHRRRRRLVQPAMHHRQINGYLGIMTEHADNVIARLSCGQQLDVYQAFRTAIRHSTIESLFGKRLAADAEFLGDNLQLMINQVDRLPVITAWHRRLRTPSWRRATTARKLVDERIYAEITQTRRGETDADDHVLHSLVHGRDGDGNGLTDQEIRDQMVSMISAGYDTTSAAMSWAIYAMLDTPGVWDRAAAEVAAVLGGRVLTAADLKDLPYLNGVVQETLRLYPPTVMAPRRVVTPFEYEGRHFPAGAMLLFSPYVTHRLPEAWSEPLSFRPERWDPADPAHHRPGPHDYLPFGGGPHRCVGSVLATTELMVMLCRLLASTSLRLTGQRVRGTSFTAMRPHNGLWVEVVSVSIPQPVA